MSEQCCPTCGRAYARAQQPAGLTPRQKDALDFIRAYIAAHDGVPPTVREIGAGIKCRSTGRIAELLSALEERGHIARLHHKMRSIVILDGDAQR